MELLFSSKFSWCKAKAKLAAQAKNLCLLLNLTTELLDNFHTMNILNFLIQWSNLV
jgi:hypothetical protein